MRSPIETKVALPALIMGPLIIVVPSLFAVARAYEVLAPTPEQVGALAALGAALQYVAHVYLGYRAPHTARPDLPPEEIDYAMQGEALGARRVDHPHLDETRHS